MITDEEEVANTFNSFFVEKISVLKENIDPARIKDPLEKLVKKVKGRNLKFSLKTVTEIKVKKILKGMKKKKSAGPDGLSQECLLLGKEIL